MRVKLLPLKGFSSDDFCNVFILYYEHINLATSSYEQKMIVYLLPKNKISSGFGFSYPMTKSFWMVVSLWSIRQMLSQGYDSC